MQSAVVSAQLKGQWDCIGQLRHVLVMSIELINHGYVPVLLLRHICVWHKSRSYFPRLWTLPAASMDVLVDTQRPTVISFRLEQNEIC